MTSRALPTYLARERVLRALEALGIDPERFAEAYALAAKELPSGWERALDAYLRTQDFALWCRMVGAPNEEDAKELLAAAVKRRSLDESA